MTKKITVTLTETEAREAASACCMELNRQRADATRTPQQISAIERAMMKLYSREEQS